MAMLMKPSAYQHPALATQLTPPPSPERITATTTIRYTANTGKMRRERTPEPLNLKQSNYEPYFKKQSYAKIIAEIPATKRDETFLVPKRKPSNLAANDGISPLSADFEITGAADVSRPASYFPIEQQSPVFPVTPRSKYSIATPTIHEARFARQLPVSAFSSQTPKSIALERKDSTRPEVPKLVTLSRKPVQRSISLRQPPILFKQDDQARKELPLPPPPPRKETSPQRTIVPSIDPDVFPMPESDKNAKKAGRLLRSVQSIGMLHAGPKVNDPTRWDSRPSTARSNTGFHRRIFSGGMFGSTSPTRSMQSSLSAEQQQQQPQPRMVRRLSQLSRSRTSQTLEDPLAPVSVIQVMSNQEDVAGGLTYLPRYTNNFAGFCKSAWRLQLADAKSFEIKNRNSKTQMPMLKCSKCIFEGPLYPQHIVGDRYVWAKVPDSKVYSSFGISYTWQFLFKSHLASKKDNKAAKPAEGSQYSHPLAPPVPKHHVTEVDMADGLFGCILCCSKGIGVPVFKGPESLSWHLRSHANDTIKDQEVIHRFKIIIGRDPEPNEKFDVHIPRISGSETNGASVSVAVNGDGKWEEPGKISSENAYSSHVPADRTAGPTSVSTPMLDFASDNPWGSIPPVPNVDAITLAG